MKTCNNIAEKGKKQLFVRSDAKQHICIFICHVMQITLAMKHYLPLLFIQIYNYAGVYHVYMYTSNVLTATALFIATDAYNLVGTFVLGNVKKNVVEASYPCILPLYTENNNGL